MAQTWTAQSGGGVPTNHEAVEPPYIRQKYDSISLTHLSILKVKIFLKIISWLTDAQGTFLKLFVEESIEA